MGNAEEAKAEARFTEPGSSSMDAPPPAYTPYEYGAGAPSSSAATPPNAQTSLPPINMSTSIAPYHVFPTSMKLYYRHWKISRTIHLGDSFNHRLYAVSSYAGVSGRGPGVPCIILHNGPSDKDAALAMIGEEKHFTLASRTSIISLPPLKPPAAGAGTSSSQDQGMHSVTEIMRGEPSGDGSSLAFRFSVEVSQPKDNSGESGLQREDFEWRAMSSDEIEGFKGGLKLFRMGPRAFCSSTGVLHGSSGDSTQVSKDAEVVASTMFKGTLNMNKPFIIDFIGSGLTGELGDRWAVMAIITALQLWYLNIQGRTKEKGLYMHFT